MVSTIREACREARRLSEQLSVGRGSTRSYFPENYRIGTGSRRTEAGPEHCIFEYVEAAAYPWWLHTTIAAHAIFEGVDTESVVDMGDFMRESVGGILVGEIFSRAQARGILDNIILMECQCEEHGGEGDVYNPAGGFDHMAPAADGTDSSDDESLEHTARGACLRSTNSVTVDTRNHDAVVSAHLDFLRMAYDRVMSAAPYDSTSANGAEYDRVASAQSYDSSSDIGKENDLVPSTDSYDSSSVNGVENNFAASGESCDSISYNSSSAYERDGDSFGSLHTGDSSSNSETDSIF